MTQHTPLKTSSHHLLNFSYRLRPTREHEVWLGEASEQLRHWWNALVGEQKHAHRQIARKAAAALWKDKKPALEAD